MSTPWKNTVAWEPVEVPGRLKPWPERLQAVIADLDVTTAIRYAPKPPSTFCNIYVTDIIRNMGLKAPTHWMTGQGDPAKVGQGIEMSANRLAVWLKNHGGRYGWWQADEGTSCNAAERGHLVLAIWQSDGRRQPGHVAIVLGEEDGETWITQAGAENFRRCTLRAGFGKLPVQFWIQAEREGGHEGHTHPAA